MAKVLIGNFKGPQGGQGIPGPQGEQGDQGIRGSRWTEGTAITGTSTTPTVFRAQEYRMHLQKICILTQIPEMHIVAQLAEWLR